MKFNVLKFGYAFGITAGIYLFFLAAVAWLFNLGIPMVNAISTLYIGYDATFLGAIIGAVYGAVDGFIGGIIFAALYNKFLK